MATLVCEYYAEVGIREKLVAVGKAASAGSAEQALLGSTFEPATLMRLPRTNRPGGQFPALAMFTFPHGARLVTHEEAMANAIPVVTSFVLTAEDKSRMYGACIVWYEELPAAVALTFLEQLELVPADGASLPTLHAPEAICLLSRMPVFEGLMECCRQLFRMRLQASRTAPLPSPLAVSAEARRRRAQAAGAIPEELLEPLLGARLPGASPPRRSYAQPPPSRRPHPSAPPRAATRVHTPSPPPHRASAATTGRPPVRRLQQRVLDPSGQRDRALLDARRQPAAAHHGWPRLPPPPAGERTPPQPHPSTAAPRLSAPPQLPPRSAPLHPSHSSCGRGSPSTWGIC